MTKEDGTAELGRDELRALLNAAEAWRDELDGLLDPEREAEADELGELIRKVKRDNDMEVDDDVDYVEFDSKFHTIQNPDDPTEGDHLTFEQTAPYPINRVWTVVEGDDGGTVVGLPGHPGGQPPLLPCHRGGVAQRRHRHQLPVRLRERRKVMTGQPIRDTFEVCFNAELTVMPGTVLPDLPGLTPEVSIDFDNGPRTYVTVNDEHCLFWTDGDEVLNSTEYESVWPSLSDEDREALLEWGAGVHERIDAAIYGLMIEATNAPGVRERIVRSATISNPEEEL